MGGTRLTFFTVAAQPLPRLVYGANSLAYAPRLEMAWSKYRFAVFDPCGIDALDSGATQRAKAQIADIARNGQRTDRYPLGAGTCTPTLRGSDGIRSQMAPSGANRRVS